MFNKFVDIIHMY